MSSAVADAVATALAEADAAATAAASAQAAAESAASAAATATSSAEASASGDATAFAAAIANSSASAFSHTEAAATAAATAQAAAYACAAAYANAQAAALSGVQSIASAVATAETEAEAAASAYASAEASARVAVEALAQAVADAQAAALAAAHAEATAHAAVSVGVSAMADAYADAEAYAHAAALAQASAEAEVAVGVEAIALANADAEAAAFAAALAQADAYAEVAVGVEAAAAAMAEAAAYAYAAAAAEANAYASAFASATAMADARADAFSAAEAMALAMASASASANAAANAAARAVVAAEATAEALATAFAMASAAANAEATAQTSVDVVPDIETSIQSFIDPDCLEPVCEEREPCDCGEEVPTTPSRPTTPDCPETEDLLWNFGEVPTGVNFRGSQSIPMEIRRILDRVPIVESILLSENLPTGASIELDLDNSMAQVAGNFVEGRSYAASYGLVDPGQCLVYVLTITVGTGTPAPGQETPGAGNDQGQQETPSGFARDCFSVAAYYETQVLFFTTRTEIVSTVTFDGSMEFTPTQYCGTIGSYVVMEAAQTANGPQQQQLSFLRWEFFDDPSEEWTTYSEQRGLTVQINEVSQYRAIYGEGNRIPGTSTPGTTPYRPCVTVSAVHMYQRLDTTAFLTTPQYGVDPLTISVTVDEEAEWTSPADVCGEAGSRHSVTVPEQAWTQEQLPLEFWKWQKYNNEEGVWEDLLVLQLFGTPATTINVTLQGGGQLRAVYRTATVLD